MTQLHLIMNSVKNQVNKVILFENDFIDLFNDDNNRTYFWGDTFSLNVPDESVYSVFKEREAALLVGRRTPSKGNEKNPADL